MVFIKLPVPEDFLSRGGELKEAVVWSCDTLHTDINMFIHKYSMLLSHSFVGFGFFYFVFIFSTWQRAWVWIRWGLVISRPSLVSSSSWEVTFLEGK